MPDAPDDPKDFQEGPAAEAEISLSQALLAPLDAIFKAQIHAARSFLNLLLQIGYRHQPLGASGEPIPDSGTPYTLDFFHEVTLDGERRLQRISVPALALIPISPLAVDSAEFTFDMTVRSIARHEQMQRSDRRVAEDETASGRNPRQSRPWFLVSDPVSVRGTLAPKPEESGRTATIHVAVKLANIPIPAGLDKLLTSLTQVSELADVTKAK